MEVMRCLDASRKENCDLEHTDAFRLSFPIVVNRRWRVSSECRYLPREFNHWLLSSACWRNCLPQRNHWRKKHCKSKMTTTMFSSGVLAKMGEDKGFCSAIPSHYQEIAAKSLHGRWFHFSRCHCAGGCREGNRGCGKKREVEVARFKRSEISRCNISHLLVQLVMFLATDYSSIKSSGASFITMLEYLFRWLVFTQKSVFPFTPFYQGTCLTRNKQIEQVPR